MTAAMRRLQIATDRFLFESCDPLAAVLLRIGYATLLIVCTAVWMLDGGVWFSEAGPLSTATAKLLGEPQRWSVLYVLPSTPKVAQTCLSVLLVQSFLLLT